MDKIIRNRKPRGVEIPHSLIDSDAWKNLTVGARACFVMLVRRYNGSNNGKFPYSVRQMAERVRCSPATASRWLKELVSVGFLKEVKKGGFNYKIAPSDRKATLWRLTHLATENLEATHDYLKKQG